MNERNYSSSSRVASAVAALIGESAAQRLLGRLGGILVVHSSELVPAGSTASFEAAKSGMRAAAQGNLIRPVRSVELSEVQAGRVMEQRNSALRVRAGSAAQAFYSPATDTIVLVEDRIAKGDETAVYLHEVVHRRGRKAIGQEGWDRLVERVKGWDQRPEGSIERQVRQVAFSRAKRAVGEGHRHFFEEFFAYSVEEAVRLGVKPNIAAIEDSAEQWLGDVVITLQSVIFQSTQSMVDLDAQQIVNLAYALAQLENPDRSEQILRALAKGQERASPPSEQSLKKDALGFYSALARGVSAIPTKQATVPAWAALLRGLVNKGLVKQDEITWSGLEDWLSLQQGRVTKEQVLEYLRGNGVQVQEVMLGSALDDSIQRLREERDRVEQSLDELGFEIHNEFGCAVLVKRVNGLEYVWEDGEFLDEDGEPIAATDTQARELALRYGKLTDEMEFNDGQPTEVDRSKYGSYTLPGGENYREVLLTLPGLSATAAEIAAAKARELSAKMRKAETDAEYEQLRAERAELAGKAKNVPLYRSSHWGQPNIIAHIRVNDRVDADGAKVLFVEEVQSDWGQDGNKKGFAGEKVKGYQVQVNGTPVMTYDTPEEADAHAGRALKLNAPEAVKIVEVMALKNVQQDAGKAPRAPFVTKTEGWLNLALKRIITMAVDGGYDKVAFITGQQSMERYDLSKKVHAVSATENNGLWDIMIRPDRRDGFVDAKSGVMQGDLSDVVGKGLAEKIIADGPGIYSGLDLRIGGEGMIAFYDKIVPSAVKALAKKMGGQMRVMEMPINKRYTAQEQDRFFEQHGYQPEDNASTTQLGFVITPAMRERVADGLPLFSRADIEGTDNFRNWFGDSKAVDVQGKPLVLYHGTRAEFDAFDGGDRGAWFASSPGAASEYAIWEGEVDGAPRVLPVYLSIANPYTPTASERRGIWQARQKDEGFEQMERALVERAKQSGHDGIVWGDGTYVAFHPEQVKSAIGNNGEFDPETSNILMSHAPQAAPLAGGAADAPSASNFDKWFGSSVVRDEAGQPLVLYHGTIIRPDSAKVKSMGDIKAFDRLFTTQFRRPSVDTVGVWFSTNPGDGGAGMYAGKGDGSVIYPVHLSIKNPQETTFELLLRRARLLHNGEDDGRMIGEAEVNAYRKWLEDMGKDGIKIVHDEWAANGSTEFKDQGVWIALRPEQIKSAVGNRGTYESTSPDILCSLAEQRSDIASVLGGNAGPAAVRLAQWWAAARPVGDGMDAMEKASGDAPYILDPVEDAGKRWRIADVPIDLVLDSGIAPEPHRLQERLDAIRGVESPERPIFELGQDGMVRILDGWHRLQVAKERGQTTVSALVGLGDALTPPSQSEAFRRWFGASVVVGVGGEPLVVYRGDRPNKTVFTGREDPSNYIQGNIFFSSEPAIAKFYTRHRTDYMASPADLGPADGLYRVYLSLQNPLIVDAKGEDWCGIPNPFEPDEKIQIDDLALEAQKRGYDGLVVRDVWDQAGDGDQYVVFSAEQIKSATDNNGDFDCENPDILMSEMPGEQVAEDEAVEPIVDEHSFMRSRCG